MEYNKGSMENMLSFFKTCANVVVSKNRKGIVVDISVLCVTIIL